MTTTRRSFVRKAVSATGGMIATICLPRAVFAGCSSSTQSFAFADINDQQVATIADWKLGDCELKQATLRISGNFVILNGQVCTHFTHTKDVWHMTVQLVTRSNTDPSKEIVLASGKFDGPQMSEQDKPLFHTWSARFGINANALKGHRFAAKVTSCC
jgi:hypothetical protein